MSTPRILDTPVILCKFSFPCEKRWDDLSEISGEHFVRYCSECTKTVFLCSSYEDLYEHVEKEHCVAVLCSDAELRMGRAGRPRD